MVHVKPPRYLQNPQPQVGFAMNTDAKLALTLEVLQAMPINVANYMEGVGSERSHKSCLGAKAVITGAFEEASLNSPCKLHLLQYAGGWTSEWSLRAATADPCYAGPDGPGGSLAAHGLPHERHHGGVHAPVGAVSHPRNGDLRDLCARGIPAHTGGSLGASVHARCLRQ